MAEVFTMPGYTPAEFSVISIGKFVDQVKNMPIEELHKSQFSVDHTEAVLPAAAAIARIAGELYEVSRALNRYERQLRIQRMIRGKNPDAESLSEGDGA